MVEVSSVMRALNDRVGKSQITLTDDDVARLGILLEELTYFDAAKRTGVSESSIKQTMSRIQSQHEYVVKPLYRSFENWMVERSKVKKRLRKAKQ